MTCGTLRRCGTALLAVLLALSLTAALVVGGAYVTRQLAAASAIGQRGAQLEPSVEEAIARAVVSWDSVTRAAQPVGTTSDLGADFAGRVQVTVRITRASARVYWVVGDAIDNAKPLLRRRLGLLVLVGPHDPVPVASRAWTQLR